MKDQSLPDFSIAFLDPAAIRAADLERSAAWYGNVPGPKMEPEEKGHPYFLPVYAPDPYGHAVELTALVAGEGDFYGKSA